MPSLTSNDKSQTKALMAKIPPAGAGCDTSTLTSLLKIPPLMLQEYSSYLECLLQEMPTSHLQHQVILITLFHFPQSTPILPVWISTIKCTFFDCQTHQHWPLSQISHKLQCTFIKNTNHYNQKITRLAPLENPQLACIKSIHNQHINSNYTHTHLSIISPVISSGVCWERERERVK